MESRDSKKKRGISVPRLRAPKPDASQPLIIGSCTPTRKTGLPLVLFKEDRLRAEAPVFVPTAALSIAASSCLRAEAPTFIPTAALSTAASSSFRGSLRAEAEEYFPRVSEDTEED